MFVLVCVIVCGWIHVRVCVCVCGCARVLGSVAFVVMRVLANVYGCVRVCFLCVLC